ncbi:MAG: hypothetical protein ACE5F2_02035 [Candidatus Paceibacteria bacterium]
MENDNIGQMGTDKKPMSVMLIVIIVVIIAIIAGLYFWLSSGSSDDAKEVPQEEQTLGEQISGGAATDNPASEVPQANVFEAETNPFKEDGFKNPFE